MNIVLKNIPQNLIRNFLQLGLDNGYCLWNRNKAFTDVDIEIIKHAFKAGAIVYDVNDRILWSNGDNGREKTVFDLTNLNYPEFLKAINLPLPMKLGNYVVDFEKDKNGVYVGCLFVTWEQIFKILEKGGKYTPPAAK